jgi:dTDP-4-dehydrorhamnose 3,5-epimerase
MEGLEVWKTLIEGVFLIEPKVFGDTRGFFFESYTKKKYGLTGIDVDFVQDNHSKSSQGVLRGLHYQISKPQDKLVRVTQGMVFDVAVDIRKNSPTFGHWVGFILSEQNMLQLFVPKGFAHGFCVLSEKAEFLYKCSDYYFPEDEGGIIWDDPDLNVNWPIKDPRLSEKDKKYPRLKDIFDLNS